MLKSIFLLTEGFTNKTASDAVKKNFTVSLKIRTLLCISKQKYSVSSGNFYTAVCKNFFTLLTFTAV